MNEFLNSNWKFNTLNIYNFNLRGPYEFIFYFLDENLEKLDGDILEAGSFQGRMTLSLAHFLNTRQSSRKIHAFDTFSGFPKYAKEDSFDNFREMFKTGIISSHHYENIESLKEMRSWVIKDRLGPDNLSSSGNFSNTSLELIQAKASRLGLENITFHVGDFKNTMKFELAQPEKLLLVFLDCDLYDGYVQTLEFSWDRLVAGGIIFLDEYYSLKFPGPRLAVNRFVSFQKNAILKNVASVDDDFERWIIEKQG